MSDSPFFKFEQWFQEALRLPARTPSSMVLATVGEDGRPSSRILLLKDWDQRGFVFYTNFTSRKAKDLAANSFASLLFYWDALAKQVRIEGSVEKISKTEAEHYFQSRPLESRWGAWASHQSRSLSERSVLTERFLRYQKKYPVDVPLPEFWGGYRLVPDRFEFWENREHRLHHRELYEKKDDQWVSGLLYP